MSWFSEALDRRPDWAQSFFPDLSSTDYSALRPRRMWEEFRPRATRDPEQNYLGNIAPLRDLFGTAWHGRDWRRSERGYGEGSEEQHRQDRWATPIFRMAMLGALGSMANSFGGPWGERGPGYGTLGRAGGGALNNMLGGGMPGMGMPGGGGNSGGGAMDNSLIPPYQGQDPFAPPPFDMGALAAALMAMQRRSEEEPESEEPFFTGNGGLV